MFENLAMVKMRRNKFIIEKGCHDTNVLMIVLSGRFIVNFGGESTVINSGDAVFFRKNQPFTRSVAQPIEIIYITFNITNEKFFPEKNCRIRIDDSRMQQNIKLLCENPELLCYVATDIIINNHSFGCLKKASTADEFLEFIRNNLHAEIDLSALAKKFNLSPSGLIYIVRKATGKTPKEVLTCYRMERAEELLLGTDKQIKEIAVLCGYQNEYYFSNAFKKHKGLSPSNYRQKYVI